MKKMTKYDWLEVNGFSREQVTYVVMGNSYSIKDTLKDEGFKFSPLLRWHTKDKNFELPDDCYYLELKYDDIFEWDEGAGVSYLLPGARATLDAAFNPTIANNSNYVGELDERLTDISAHVRNVSGFDSAYGYKWVYSFEDASGNVFTWFTTTQQPLATGQRVILSGTVKNHAEYRGIRTTYLIRCRVKILETVS